MFSFKKSPGACAGLALGLVALSAPTSTQGWPSQSGQARPLVFTHVTVIDATGSPAKPDMTLVVVGYPDESGELTKDCLATC